MKPNPSPDVAELPPPPPGKTGWPWTEGSLNISEDSDTTQNTPKISIVTPSYNQASFIEATLRSVILQGYPNLEYIIIDGSSNDGSQEIISKYEKWIHYWTSEPDRGQVHAINKGAARASGDIFSWLNSDDLLLPGALRIITRMYQEHPRSVAWVGGCYRIRPDGIILSRVIPRNLDQESLVDWWWQGFFYQPSLFFRTRSFEDLGGLDESLYISFDIDWFIRLAMLGEYASSNAMLSAATIHTQAKTQVTKKKMYSEMSLVQMKYMHQDYQKPGNSWLVRSLKSPIIRRHVIEALGEIVLSRVQRYCPWEWSKYPRTLQAVLSSENRR